MGNFFHYFSKIFEFVDSIGGARSVSSINVSSSLVHGAQELCHLESEFFTHSVRYMFFVSSFNVFLKIDYDSRAKEGSKTSASLLSSLLFKLM